jgi:hypothetical protein
MKTIEKLLLGKDEVKPRGCVRWPRPVLRKAKAPGKQPVEIERNLSGLIGDSQPLDIHYSADNIRAVAPEFSNLREAGCNDENLLCFK